MSPYKDMRTPLDNVDIRDFTHEASLSILSSNSPDRVDIAIPTQNIGKMLTTTLLSTFLASTAFALPHLTPRHPRSTNVTYYQGTPTDANSCGQVAVSTGTVTAGDCNQAYTYSLTVQPLPHRDCLYVLWKDTTTCGVDSDEPSSNFENYFLPAGGHPVCVTAGVLDGGAHTFASGEFRCDVDIN